MSIFHEAKKHEPAIKDDLLNKILDALDSYVTPTDVRKAFAILIKCQIFKRFNTNEMPEKLLWGISDKKMNIEDMLTARDMAIVARIHYACQQEGIVFDTSVIGKMLYSTNNPTHVANIIEDTGITAPINS